MTFKELRLAEPIVRAVAAEGYVTPTPIQVQAIPKVLAGNDLLGCAQTGTGKTGAFALPILHRLSQAPPDPRNGGRRSARCLVLCPTRELATQIADSFAVYGRNLTLRTAAIFGGVNQSSQVRALSSGLDVLVATPGRLQDLMDQGYVDLRAVEVLVLDEADRMLDMGFIQDIRRIVAKLPKRRQTLLFSATMPDEIRRLAASILHEPLQVQVDPEGSTVDTIAQSVYHVRRQDKLALLAGLLQRNGTCRTLVFTRTKHGADKVVKGLARQGIRAEAIHGNKSQNARTRALNGFRSGAAPVLVATDIAARGIDIDDISHVINYDIPNIPETYVHRIGRTARAGASGVALAFCDPQERDDLRAIEKLIRMRLEVADDGPQRLRDAPEPAPQPRGERHAPPHRSTRVARPAPASPAARTTRAPRAEPVTARRRSVYAGRAPRRPVRR